MQQKLLYEENIDDYIDIIQRLVHNYYALKPFYLFCYSRCYWYIVTLPVTSIHVLQRCFELLCWLYCMNGLICIYRKPITLALTSPQTAVFNITETDSHTVSP